MKFFVSWSAADPNFVSYFSDVHLLISPSTVAQSWTLNCLSTMPSEIILDSGAFTLMRHTKKWSQKDVFEWQMRAVRGVTVPVWLGHLDQPVPPDCNSKAETFRRIETTLARAYEFVQLVKKTNFPQNIQTLGVIQGGDYESVRFCAREMARIGFDLYGIGSLAPLCNTATIMERISGAMEIVGKRLHIFGVSSLEVIKLLIDWNIHSCDSSRPTKAAIYGDVFYSNPFRTFTVPSSRKDKSYNVLEQPSPCICPICIKNPYTITVTGNKKSNNQRAIHNYYHLREEINQMERAHLFHKPQFIKSGVYFAPSS